MTGQQLRAALAERFPGLHAPALAYACRCLLPLVQVPPRGVWGKTLQVTSTPVESWLGRPLSSVASLDEVVLRYLAAFGPASVGDIQAWSGLTRLREVSDRLREQLRSFEDEQGRELLDVRGAPLPDPDTPAPPRFLPPFDNAILSYDDRSRIIAREDRDIVYRDRLMRTFLVDGFVAGTWQSDGSALWVQPIRTLSDDDRSALAEEGRRLLEFIAPEGAAPQVRFGTAGAM